MYKRTYMSAKNIEQQAKDIVAPIGRILVEEVEQEITSKGGVILTSASDPENTCRLGKIIYNGIIVDGHCNTSYSEGNKLYFGKYAGSTIKHEGNTYISLTESEVAAITN